MNLFIKQLVFSNRLLKNPIENQRIFDVTNVEMVEKAIIAKLVKPKNFGQR